MALVWWRAVDGVCALLGAVWATRCCVRGWVLRARLDAVCARRCVQLARFAQYFCITQRYTDVLFLGSANSRLLLLARRCYGSNDEPGRRCGVEPNVDWSRLLAVVGLPEKEFQLWRWCCWLQCQWFSDDLVKPTKSFALSRSLFVFVC